MKGLGTDAIKARKGVLLKEQLMDRMDTMELPAHQFQMTQTRDKLNEAASKDKERPLKPMKI